MLHASLKIQLLNSDLVIQISFGVACQLGLLLTKQSSRFLQNFSRCFFAIFHLTYDVANIGWCGSICDANSPVDRAKPEFGPKNVNGHYILYEIATLVRDEQIARFIAATI